MNPTYCVWAWWLCCPNVPAQKQEKTMQNEFLTVSQLATRWQCSDKTLYAMIQIGQISVLRVGNLAKNRPTIRIPMASITEYEQAQLGQQTAQPGTNIAISGAK
jgi:excisionase family DNA binding protein